VSRVVDMNLLRLRGGAEVGKGDPRWIVTERADGKNVGAWHWEERNMMQWSRQRIDEIIGVSAQMNNFDGRFSGSMSVVNVTRVSGDAVIHQRKGRLWPLCDMNVVFAISGQCRQGDGEDVTFTGSISFPEVTVDDRDDLEMTATVNGAGAEREAAGRWLRKEGGNAVKEAVQGYIDDLSAKASSGTTSVSDAVSAAAQKDLAKAKEAAAKMAQVNKAYQDHSAASPSTPAADAEDAGSLSGEVSMAEEFAARREDLFDALTNVNKVAAYTRCSDTLLEARAGGRFSWFNALVTGGIEQLHAPEYVQMRWRLASWPAGHFSSVKLYVKDNGDHQGCRVELKQTGVPQNLRQDTERLWRERIFNQIKLSFGYGTVSNAHSSLFSSL